MIIDPPIIITNFKAYPESTGARAVELAKMHELVAREMGVNLAICGMLLDLGMLAAAVSLPVISQHLDGVPAGPHTGLVPVEIAKAMGIDGTLLNHSERRISDSEMKRALEDLKKFNMFSVVCAENVDEGHEYAEMGADFVAIEPPELIGGEISVSSGKPELITEAVSRIGAGKVIVGAGIKNGADVRRALELGAIGVLVSSGVVKAEDPMAALRDLSSGLKAA